MVIEIKERRGIEESGDREKKEVSPIREDIVKEAQQDRDRDDEVKLDFHQMIGDLKDLAQP
jgi:hypothetical protein